MSATTGVADCGIALEWCSVRSSFAQPAIALAMLLVLPLLSSGSRARAGYVPVNSLCQKAVAPVAKDRWCGADPDASGTSAAFESLPVEPQGDEQVSPPNPRPSLPCLLRQVIPFAARGGMTQPGSGSGAGGLVGPLAGLPSQAPDLGAEPCARFFLDNPTFVPSPAISGLFRPPRAAPLPCA
jgi:hypothetical protein